jgi:hypothetical protein
MQSTGNVHPTIDETRVDASGNLGGAEIVSQLVLNEKEHYIN